MELCILIADDSAQFLDAARLLLERQQLRVEVVATSAEALAETSRLQPDVVLVDVMLGGESGFELARRLNDVNRSFRPPVILISTHAEEDLRDLIAESPALGFLPKGELGADAIRRLLAQRSA